MPESKIRVYRQQIAYKSVNSRVIETTATYYMHILTDDKTKLTQGLWVYELDGYIANLVVTDSENNQLPVLSYDELNKIIQNNNISQLDIQDELVTEEKLSDLLLKQEELEGKKFPLSNFGQTDSDGKKHLIGILLPQKDSEYLEQLTVKWTEQIDETKLKKFPKDLNQFASPQHKFQPTTINSVYIDISIDSEKYELDDIPNLIAIDKDGNKIDKKEAGKYIEEILCDKQHYIFRIKRHCPYSFTVKWKIGIPKLVKHWATFGSLVAISIIGFSIYNFILDFNTFDFDAKILAGLIALLVGFRAMLLHDYDLMVRWNKTYLIFVAAAIITIIGMALTVSIISVDTPTSIPHIDLIVEEK